MQMISKIVTYLASVALRSFGLLPSVQHIVAPVD